MRWPLAQLYLRFNRLNQLSSHVTDALWPLTSSPLTNIAHNCWRWLIMRYFHECFEPLWGNVLFRHPFSLCRPGWDEFALHIPICTGGASRIFFYLTLNMYKLRFFTLTTLFFSFAMQIREMHTARLFKTGCVLRQLRSTVSCSSMRRRGGEKFLKSFTYLWLQPLFKSLFDLHQGKTMSLLLLSCKLNIYNIRRFKNDHLSSLGREQGF